MAPTQAALYGGLSDELHLSWSEQELPERERTKHVHRLHPYLGKFVPQLVEALLGRYVPVGGRVLDPFAGSGTTLVQCLESGLRRCRRGRRGVQLPADASEDAAATTSSGSSPICAMRSAGSAALARARPRRLCRASGSLRRRRPSSCTSARSSTSTSTPTSFVSCSRARRGRRASPRTSISTSRSVPQREPYWCHKHRRECVPVPEAAKFLSRYLARHARPDQGVPEGTSARPRRRGRARRLE